jgi:DnaJ-class molecular chaperone
MGCENWAARDYYRIMGLRQEATEEEIKKE